MELTRRNFVKTAGVAAGVVAAGAQIAVADEPAIDWEAQTDVVILGTGAAGLSAAITILSEGLGECIVLESSPEQYQGGNSRACGQIVFTGNTVEDLLAYQKACNADYVVEDELMQAWAEGLIENVPWLNEVCGCDMQVIDQFNPEFPELPCADNVDVYANHGIQSGAIVWNDILATAQEWGADIRYDSRAVELIQDAAGMIIGVRTEDGRAFKARRGVILACGGFECNEDMLKEHYPVGHAHIYTRGTWWNKGDGIKMAESVGAKMWHMNAFVGHRMGFQICLDSEEATGYIAFKSKDYIVVGPNACRYMNEEDNNRLRHGKCALGGTWLDFNIVDGSWALFGQKAFEAGPIYSQTSGYTLIIKADDLPTNETMLANGLIFKAQNIEELAAATGLDATVLQGTLDRYNGFAEINDDKDFHRGVAMDEFGITVDNPGFNGKAKVKAFDLEKIEFPIYAVRARHTLLNTQGGPKRSAKGEVMGFDGNPIPRLFVAGEMGTIYAFMYNGGGNFSEAMSSGRIAARSAAACEPWA